MCLVTFSDGYRVNLARLRDTYRARSLSIVEDRDHNDDYDDEEVFAQANECEFRSDTSRAYGYLWIDGCIALQTNKSACKDSAATRSIGMLQIRDLCGVV